MLFVDASVIVAIIQMEPDAEDLIQRMDECGGPYYVSAIVRMEAVQVIAMRLARANGRKDPVTPEILNTSRQLVEQFFADIEAKEISISGDIGMKALDAAQAFGEIVSHPAKLNMGDCLSYACALAYRTKIAFKGKNFSHTDRGW